MINNRIVNGGFETGTLFPFVTNNVSFVSIDNTHSHSGTFSARLSRGLSEGISKVLIAQSFLVSPNETFELFVSLAKLGPAPSPIVNITISYYNGSTLLENGLSTFIIPNRIPDINENDWVEIYETPSSVPATANIALIVITVVSKPENADIFIDDVALLTVPDLPYKFSEPLSIFTTSPVQTFTNVEVSITTVSINMAQPALIELRGLVGWSSTDSDVLVIWKIRRGIGGPIIWEGHDGLGVDAGEQSGQLTSMLHVDNGAVIGSNIYELTAMVDPTVSSGLTANINGPIVLTATGYPV